MKKQFNPPRPRGFLENSVTSKFPHISDNLIKDKEDAFDPNLGLKHKGREASFEPYIRPEGQSQIIKVDGKDAYSQLPSLYPGQSNHRNLPIDSGEDTYKSQPGIDKDTGIMPPGAHHEEPPRTYITRDKFGFAPYPQFPEAQKHPKISPQASNVNDSSVYHGAIHTTWRDLKSALGMGMGLRTNKYLLELDIPVLDAYKWPRSSKLNILCQSMTFPSRSINVASVYRFGRKYNLRGETNFNDSINLTFLDDSSMTIRGVFDDWLKSIDDSKLQYTALEGVSTNWKLHTQTRKDTKKEIENGWINKYDYEAQFHPIAGKKASGTKYNAFTGITEPTESKVGEQGEDYKEYDFSRPLYQTDVRLYQLDQTGNKVAGYLLQNCFITNISEITYQDSEINTLVRFDVTLTYSEFLPLKHQYLAEKIGVDGKWWDSTHYSD